MTVLAEGYGQVTLGIGIVKIEFDSNTVVDFYKSPTDRTFTKRIEFFDDKSINSWNIKNLEREKTWLKPEVLWLDSHNLISGVNRQMVNGWNSL